MRKIKFDISGLHNHSRAKTIEEKLTSVPGVFTAKVNYDSHKAVVVYDDQKIDGEKILHIIKETGDVGAVQISDTAEQTSASTSGSMPEPPEDRTPQDAKIAKISFWNGVLTSVSVLSLIVNIYLGTNVFKVSASSATSAPLVKNDVPSLPRAQASPTQTPNAPAIQTFSITQADHVRGNFNAPITLVEFSDFECPFCGRHYPTVNKILAEYPGKVRLVYKHFPLSFHPNAQKASEAAECAGAQGKFWEYHDILFEKQSSGYSVEKFKTWAEQLGLNTTKFDTCLDSGASAGIVQTDAQEGGAKGVNGTPATFVNGQLVSGALPYETFKQIIESELQ